MSLNRGDVAMPRFPHAGGSRGKATQAQRDEEAADKTVAGSGHGCGTPQVCGVRVSRARVLAGTYVGRGQDGAAPDLENASRPR